MKYKLCLIISVIILLLVVFNLPSKEEQELKTDTLIAYIDGRRTDTIPTKSKDIKVDRIVCDNNADAEWDDANWGIYISDITNNSTKCSVYFKTFPAPELYQGLIPVIYDASGNTVVADTSTEWYNYDNHIWANAVLGTTSARSKSAGQTLSESEILQYYVWIPRYRYQLFNAVAGESTPEQMINIEFENKNKVKSNGTTNGTWLTHPAFTFGSTELNGIWVGKFEPSHSDSQYINSTTANKLACTNENCAAASGLIIKPNVISIVNNNVSNDFYVSRSIENSSVFGLNSSKVDTHMMKNIEWGALVYLTQSKYGLYVDENTCHNSDNNKTVTINGSNVNRCDVWLNNVYTGTGCGVNDAWGVPACGGAITGCSAQTSNVQNGTANKTSCKSISNYDYSWNSQRNNGRSSTTGNVYGIYDAVGGAWEHVMANQSNSSTEFVFYSRGSGFTTPPDEKYYDKYLKSAGNSATDYQDKDHSRGKLGDATREILKVFGSYGGSWFKADSTFMNDNSPWFIRSGGYHYNSRSSIVLFTRGSGSNDGYGSFRVVLTEE